jgi:hypothetical protein
MRCRLLAAAMLLVAAVPSAPAAEAPAIDARLDIWRAEPKARLRAGSPGLAGDSVFSGPDLDLDPAVPALALEAGVRAGGHRLSLGGWWLDAKGGGAFTADKAVGGSVVPAGTPVDSTLSWTSVRLQYLYTRPLATRSSDGADPPDRSDHYLALGLGAAVDRTTFRAELEMPGAKDTTSLRGVFPTPLVALEVRPFGTDALSIRGLAGGFNFMRIPNGDTSVRDPLEYRIAVRGAWNSFFVEAGYYLYHLHLERDRNEPAEDVVHMRLRAVYIGAGVAF